MAKPVPEELLKEDKDLVKEVLQKGGVIRQEAPRKNLHRDGIDEQVDKWERTRSAMHRMLIEHRSKIEDMRIQERDATGRIRSVQSLMDEAMECLFMSRRLSDLAEASGKTPLELLEEIIEDHMRKAKPAPAAKKG